MSTTAPGHAAEAIAVAAERRWAMVVLAIIGLLVAMMVVTGLHWAGMPPSRVETVNVRTLHLRGEFVESNLGTAVEADGRVTVRLVAQQYSFTPQCIVVPQGTPVTFRGTASDAIHGFVATFTTTFPTAGEQLMPCHEYCGTGHEAMWARVQVLPPAEFAARARATERLSCDLR